MARWGARAAPIARLDRNCCYRVSVRVLGRACTAGMPWDEVAIMSGVAIPLGAAVAGVGVAAGVAGFGAGRVLGDMEGIANQGDDPASNERGTGLGLAFVATSTLAFGSGTSISNLGPKAGPIAAVGLGAAALGTMFGTAVSIAPAPQ